jgi:bifunctional ADP-heptose synthase (sugar kinase/adenylyltransferase)
MAVNVYNNLLALNVNCDILTNSGITKTRMVDEISNQMLLRIDENDTIKQVSRKEFENYDLKCYDAIVISDYNKGFLNNKDIEWISNNHDLTFIDTKKEINFWIDNIKFIKINEKEYKRNESYLKNEYNGNLIVTKGKDGAVLNNEETFSIDTEHDVRDLSGAGDTFLAALVADYINNYDIRTAIKFANKCAAWVVSQKGVVTVDLKKIKI